MQEVLNLLKPLSLLSLQSFLGLLSLQTLLTLSTLLSLLTVLALISVLSLQAMRIVLIVFEVRDSFVNFRKIRVLKTANLLSLSRLLWLGFYFSLPAQAQNKMDLNDISIKGEVHNDNRLRLLARDKNKIKNYVKYRTHYRNEMIEGLLRPEPKYSAR